MRKIANTVAAITIMLALAGQMRNAMAMDVLHDTGEAVPAGQYWAQFFVTEEDNPSDEPPGKQLVAFPVRTNSMQVGVLASPTSIKQPAWLSHPVFLIGTDQQSRAWLDANLASLRQHQATGIVVNIDSYEVFREMQILAKGLLLAPASADGLALSLGVSVYPILILADGSIVQ